MRQHRSTTRRARRGDRSNRGGKPKGLSIGSCLVLLLFSPLAFQSKDAGIPWAYADILTYNGDNRRPPRSAAEYGAIQATGIVACKGGSEGGVGTGFVISTADGDSVVLTAGHIVRVTGDNTMRAPCYYEPYGQSPWTVKAKQAPKRAGFENTSDEYVRNDWGMLWMDGELPRTMPLTQRGKEEMVQLLDSGEARLKLYSRHPNPPQS